MAKDPAFLFYPNDYIGGTMGMTFEEKGAYIELLMCQFNRGHMTSHMCGQVVGRIWDAIKHKFEIDEQGLYYNVRLDIEIGKRKAYTESRKNNINGKNQYSKKEGHMDGHMTSHMEDINKDINKDIKVLNSNSLSSLKQKKEYLKESKKKTQKEKLPKIEFAENVLLTQAEYDKLSAQCGIENIEGIIQYFSLAKCAKGYKYISDYHAILKWAINGYYEEKQKYEKQYGNKQHSLSQKFNSANDLIDRMYEGKEST